MTAWRDAPTLVGRHVTLRPTGPDDRDALLAAAIDAGVADLFYTTAAGIVRDPDGFIATALAERDAGRALPFTVLTPAGEVVGMTRLVRMNETHRRLEIGGTWYAKAVRRTGVNTEAKLLLLAHAFDALGCNAIQIRTDAFNHASQRAIERLGAKRDGLLRAHQMLDGRVRDIVVYSVIACEWPGVRQNLQFLLARGEAR